MAEKRGVWKFAWHEADDLDAEGDDFEPDERADDMEVETETINPLLTAAVFLGLVVLAAIICWGLWNLTHKDENVEIPTNNEEILRQEIEPGEDSAQEIITEVADSAGENENETDTEQVNTDSELIVAEEEPVIAEESMRFTDIAETVTAKDVVNLRLNPSTTDSENIVAQLVNGEVAERIGINDITGWSKLMYNGQVVYAVSSYLTTDQDYKIPVPETNPNRVTTKDGRIIIFADVDNYVTPKQYVNLRLEPSTSQGNATIHCQINNGTVVHRTGYSEDSGWSRVEYDGVVVYVVSSMVYGVEMPQ